MPIYEVTQNDPVWQTWRWRIRAESADEAIELCQRGAGPEPALDDSVVPMEFTEPIWKAVPAAAIAPEPLAGGKSPESLAEPAKLGDKPARPLPAEAKSDRPPRFHGKPSLPDREAYLTIEELEPRFFAGSAYGDDCLSLGELYRLTGLLQADRNALLAVCKATLLSTSTDCRCRLESVLIADLRAVTEGRR